MANSSTPISSLSFEISSLEDILGIPYLIIHLVDIVVRVSEVLVCLSLAY